MSSGCVYYIRGRAEGHQPDCEKQAKRVVDRCSDSTGVDGTDSCHYGKGGQEVIST